MSDHFDGIADPRHDITDLYAFQKPGDPARTILILNVNPAAPTQATAFDPEASYELKIDTNGDARADLAWHVLFAPAGDGQQIATVYRASGDAAEDTGPVGEVVIARAPVSFDGEARVTTEGDYRFYAGLRSDPFFVDPAGFFNDFQWTGHDANADKNVFGIVLDVPHTALGPRERIGIWARTMAPRHGEPHQMDQAGRPGTSPLFIPDGDIKHAFNGSQPAEQRARFLPTVVARFQAYDFDEPEATTLALEWLPDMLPYDYTSGAGFPNGRTLADDIINAFVRLVTRERCVPCPVTPHTDLLNDFPYLGPPHPVPMVQVAVETGEPDLADASVDRML